MFAEKDCMQFIKDNCLREVNYRRNAARTRVFDSHRKDIEKCTDTNIPTIDEFKKLCIKFKKEHKKISILQQLRIALSAGLEYVNIFLSIDGMIYALVGCYSGIKYELKLEACHCLINISVVANEKQSLMTFKKIGAYLVTILDSNYYDLQADSLWLFGNLAGGHPQVCALAQKLHLEESLIILSASPSINVQLSIAYAVMQYLATAKNRIGQLSSSMIVPNLISAMPNSCICLCDIGWCFYVMSCNTSSCHHLVTHGIVQEILQKALIHNAAISTSSLLSMLRVLSNCCAVVPQAKLIALQHPKEVASFCKLCLSFSLHYFIKEILQLLANIVNQSNTADNTETADTIVEFKSCLNNVVNSCTSSKFEVQ